MNGRAYYNEIDPYAAQWLRNLIAAEFIAPGDVDERSIVDVCADDLRGYTQCHFFAGIGGWSIALRLAGWPDDRPVWTGSCPCQPFSAAGAGKAADDSRHLWPRWFPLIAECAPPVVFGEQVEAAIGWGWLDAVFADMEQEGYACGASVLPACGVGAPHIRQRLWFVGHAARQFSERRQSREGGQREEQIGGRLLLGGVADAHGGNADAARLQRGGEHGQFAQDGRAHELGDAASEGFQIGSSETLHGGRSRRVAERSDDARELADAESGRQREFGDAPRPRSGGHADGGVELGSLGDTEHGGREGRLAGWRRSGANVPSGEERHFWSDAEWIACTDGKSRPVGPGSFPLGHGIQRRPSKLRAYGNAIVPQIAAEFISAFLETEGVGG